MQLLGPTVRKCSEGKAKGEETYSSVAVTGVLEVRLEGEGRRGEEGVTY